MKKFRETGFLREVGSYEFLLKMKLLIIFLMLGILQSTASVYSQQQKLALQFENATLVDVFEEIEQNSEFTFLYSNEDVESVKGINLRVANATVDQILDACFTGTALTYTVNDRLVIIKQADSPVLIKDKVKSELETEQQKKEIKGKVTDQSGDPLPGVNVVVKGASNIGTITDFEGNYSIEVPTDAEALEYSFIGMVPQTTIVIGNSSVINVTLESSTESLDEVVVTALGIKRKVKALGFSAQQIGEDNLSEAREVNVSNFLTGKIAGVQVSGSAAGTGGSTTVTIRGNSSLTGNNQPLYVVDGIPIDNQGHDSGGLSGGNDYGDGIGNINSEDVESISVLKGPNASYLYGSRGANGVILITTKSGKARKGIGVEFNSSTSIEKINLTPKVQRCKINMVQVTKAPTCMGKWLKSMGNLTKHCQHGMVITGAPPLMEEGLL
ncbi:MAG: TonB-dependent receptor plug domain-containing protein [Chlorobi bacterium]|nr:TonB-dependent receptor plug domain-containing protein [Chlorobiota bacterium]